MAGESPYWNPKTETLGREQLQALQLAKLRYQCEWAAARSPWYQRQFAEAGFEPSQLRSFDDLRRLPLLTRDQWMGSQEARPPYGELPGDRSGGGDPSPHDVGDDRARTAAGARLSQGLVVDRGDVGVRDLGAVACGRPDTAYIAFGYGSFIGFWGLHYAMEKVGVLNVPGGAQTTEARVRQIIDFGATVVASTPTYALRLAQEAALLGVDLSGLIGRRD